MEKARQGHYPKQLSALISIEDYEFLKKTSESYDISLGDVVRGIIKNSKIEVEEKLKQEKRQKQPRLF